MFDLIAILFILGLLAIVLYAFRDRLAQVWYDWLDKFDEPDPPPLPPPPPIVNPPDKKP